MKRQREAYEDELNERLLNYTEEPEKDVWNGIASHLVSVTREPGWVAWSQQISSLVVVGVIMIGVIKQFNLKEISERSQSKLLHQTEMTNKTPDTGIQEKNKSLDPAANGNLAGSQHVKDVVVNLDSDEELGTALITHENTTESTVYTNLGEKESMQPAVSHVLPTLMQATDESLILNDTPRSITGTDTLTKSNAQKSALKRINRQHRKYTLYFTAMPTFGYQRVESNQTDNIIIESIERIPAFSTDRLGIRVELGAEFFMTKRFKLFTGVLYYQRKQTIGYTEKQFDTTLITTGPGGEIIFEPQFSYLKKSAEHELKNIGLQLGVMYRLSNKKPRALTTKEAMSSTTMLPKKTFLHVIGTGIEFHKALNKASEFNQANGFSNPTAYVFYNLFYRLQYPSEGKLRGIFQPTLNYSFYINDNLNAPFYVKPYGLGLNFGVTYNFY